MGRRVLSFEIKKTSRFVNIVVLGAGQVGKTVLAALNRGNNNITVVDDDANAVQEAQKTFQCEAIHGHASSPEVLKQAKIEDAETLIAVTASDEVNIVACQAAHEVFLTPICIARIRNLDYLGDEYRKLFEFSGSGVIQAISPELTIVEKLKNLVEFPGSIYVEEFANQQVILTCNRIRQDSEMVGKPAADFSQKSKAQAHIVGLLRKDKLVQPLENALLEAGDVAFILGKTAMVRRFSHDSTGMHKPYRQVVIAGGGIIGGNLARYLQNSSPKRNVKVIEQDQQTADKLATNLASSSLRMAVLCGSAADEGFLADNHVSDSDLFCAVTNNDIVNLVSSLTATRMGVKSVITMVQNADHLDSWLQAGIETPVSPQQTTAATIQHYVAERSLMALRYLPIFGLDLVELKVQGEQKSNKVAGRKPNQLKLPSGAHFAGLIHGVNDEGAAADDEQIQLVLDGSDHVVQNGDRLLFITENSEATNKLSRLFRPTATSLL